MMAKLRAYFFAGLLVWLPIWAVLLVIRFLIKIMEGSFSMLPEKYQPSQLLGLHIPGIELVLSLLIIFLTGMFAKNYFGHKIVGLWEKLLNKIPFVRAIYGSVKQVLQTVLSSDTKSFKKVLCVEYPRPGSWSVGFQAGDAYHEIVDFVQKEMVTVFIPTTPNPTSGFLIIVPQDEVKELNMSVDNALKFIVSLGVVQPSEKNKTINSSDKAN